MAGELSDRYIERVRAANQKRDTEARIAEVLDAMVAEHVAGTSWNTLAAHLKPAGVLSRPISGGRLRNVVAKLLRERGQRLPDSMSSIRPQSRGTARKPAPAPVLEPVAVQRAPEPPVKRVAAVVEPVAAEEGVRRHETAPSVPRERVDDGYVRDAGGEARGDAGGASGRGTKEVSADEARGEVSKPSKLTAEQMSGLPVFDVPVEKPRPPIRFDEPPVEAPPANRPKIGRLM
jgi:hypothetical protein